MRFCPASFILPVKKQGVGYGAMNYQVVETIKKGVSYHWKDSIIVNLVKRKYGVKVTSRCVRHFRNDVPCPAACREKCWMND